MTVCPGRDPKVRKNVFFSMKKRDIGKNAVF